MPPATDQVANYLGGLIAAEGTFTSWRTATKARWTFAVGLAASDRVTVETLAEFFGVGSIHLSPRRKPHYDDEVTFAVQSMREHLAVTIPFMDDHLPESHKRRQYLAWKSELLEYWEHSAKRRRPCSVDGCETPRRAHGLCRHHLWTMRQE